MHVLLADTNAFYAWPLILTIGIVVGYYHFKYRNKRKSPLDLREWQLVVNFTTKVVELNTDYIGQHPHHCHVTGDCIISKFI